MEGKVFTKRKIAGRKTAQWLRVEGAYISARASDRSMLIEWEADLFGCTVSNVSLFFNSLIINLRDDSPVYVTMPGNNRNVHDWAAKIRKASKIGFEHDYTLGEEIGSGAFSSVHSIISDDVSFTKKEWAALSPACISLIRGLLDKTPAARLMAKAALEHEWLDTTAKRAEVIEFPDKKEGPHSVLSPKKRNEGLGPPISESTISQIEASRVEAIVAIGDRLASQLSNLLKKSNSHLHQDGQDSNELQLHSQHKQMAKSVRDIIRLNVDELAGIESASQPGSLIESQESSAEMKIANSGIKSPILPANTCDVTDTEVERRQSQPTLHGTGQKASRTASIRRFLTSSLSKPRSGRGRTSRTSRTLGNFRTPNKFGSFFGRRKNHEGY